MAVGTEPVNLMPRDRGKSPALEIDTESSPPLRHEVTPRFSWGTKLNFEERLRNNRDLQESDDDLDSKTTGSLSIAGLFLSSPRIEQARWELFTELKLEREAVYKEGQGKTEDTTRLYLKKGYIIFRDFMSPSLRLQFGRQRFKDFREWVYDDNLDALRLIYEIDRLELQLSYSTNLFDPDEAKDEIKNLILYGIYQAWEKDEAAFYIVDRHGDHPELNPAASRFATTFIGFSWKGKSIKNQQYWLEAATVVGKDAGKNVSAYGFDLGWTTRLKYRFRPAFTMGYAYGSGDSNPDDNRDTTFRQTGLQDNAAKLSGVVKVEQYGEIFEPELSNVIVKTFGFGLRPTETGSIELVYHHFQQVQAENKLRNAGIKPNPNGKSRDLGEEIDLILGGSISGDLRLEAVAGVFFPGPAFPGADKAYVGKIEIEFLF